MEQFSQQHADEEPIGIVISRGSRDESVPRFSAYVWSDEPQEAFVQIDEVKAA